MSATTFLGLVQLYAAEEDLVNQMATWQHEAAQRAMGRLVRVAEPSGDYHVARPDDKAPTLPRSALAKVKGADSEQKKRGTR